MKQLQSSVSLDQVSTETESPTTTVDTPNSEVNTEMESGGDKEGFFGDMLTSIGQSLGLVHQDASRDSSDPNNARVSTQGSQFDDQKNAWDKLKAWKAGTQIEMYDSATKTNVKRLLTETDAMFVFYEATPEQRRKVYFHEGGILHHMFQKFNETQIMNVIGLCGFPLEWKVTHWYIDVIKPRPGSRGIMRRMVSNSPLGQRLVVCKSESLVKVLKADFKDDHPENLFGDAIKDNLYPDTKTKETFDKAHPEFASWRGDATKLDAEERWAEFGKGPAAAITKLKGETAAFDSSTKWASLLKWSPRGAALSGSMRQNLDKVVDDSGVSTADRQVVWEIRWNMPLTDNGMSQAQFKTIWEALARLPLGAVTSDTISSFVINNTGSGGGGYSDFPSSAGFGRISAGTSSDLDHMSHTMLHEVGHSMDTRLGGFANLASKSPINWRKWRAEEPWFKEINKAASGPTGPEEAAMVGLLSAQVNNSIFTSPFGIWGGGTADTEDKKRQKLWDAVDDKMLASDNKGALELLATAGKMSADAGAMAGLTKLATTNDYPRSTPTYIGDKYFVMKYGEHFAYDKTGAADAWARSGKAGISAWTLSSPYEFYADLYAAYYDSNSKKGQNLPGWAAPYFDKVHAQSDTVDDASKTSGDINSTPSV